MTDSGGENEIEEPKKHEKRKISFLLKNDPNRVHVYLRIKPGNEVGPPLYKVTPDEKQLNVFNTLGNVDRDKWHAFDHIYNETATNKEVYKTSGQNLVDNVLKGFNCALFAYGQTGSGKTHTLMSTDGLTAHMVSRLFSRISRDSLHKYTVTCSYFQIYQERIHDLLNANQNLEFRLREDPHEGMFIENISSYTCYSPNDVYELLNVGRKRLVFAETKMNRCSSRSHSVCQIIVKKQSKYAEDSETSNNSSNSPRSVTSSRSGTPRIPQIPEIKVERFSSPLPHTRSPPLPFKRPPLIKRHTVIGSSIVLKKEVDNAPPCNLSVVKRRCLSDGSNSSKNKSRSRPKSCTESSELQMGTMMETPEQMRSSKLPLPRSSSRNSKSPEPETHFGSWSKSPDPYRRKYGFRNTTSKTPEPRRRPLFQKHLSNIEYSRTIDSYDFLPKGRSLSSSSLKKDVGMSSNQLESSSAFSNSSESVADSVIDDMRWQIQANCLDMSKVHDDYMDDTSSVDLDYQPIEENHSIRGKLSIVDLAGSERTNRTNVDGHHLREAKHINVSLHELGNVIAALSENKKHVPYRNSKLTRLLQDSLSGNCKTSFVLCMSPAADDFMETQNTLQFGQRLLKITTKPNINVEPDYKNLVEDLKSRMKENEYTFEKKIKEYEEKLTVLRNEKLMTEEELDHQNTLSRLLKDECDTSNFQQDDLSFQLEELQIKVTKNEKLLNKRDKELEILKLENKRLTRVNEEFNSSNKTLQQRLLKEVPESIKQPIKQKLIDQCTNTPTVLCYDVGTRIDNKLHEGEPGYYNQKILDKRNKDLQDLNREYVKILKENEELRLDRSTSSESHGRREQSSCTSPLHSFDVGTNTVRECTPQTPIHKNCNQHELERMRNFLLAEVMSLQLLYSMFDLKTKTQVERESLLGGAQLVKNTSSLRENGAITSSLSTPSGYETGSHSQLDIDKNSWSETTDDNKSKANSSEYFKFLKYDKNKTDTTKSTISNQRVDSVVPKTGNLLEEIIEAQRTGSYLLSSPSSAKDLSIENRVSFLKKEISQQKRAIDDELSRVSAEHLGIVLEQGGRLHKREVYSNLVHRLSEEEFYRHYSLDSLEQILNLVLVDHSLTGCLLALSHKTKTSTINMIRRLSSYKSTNQKPLLDYSYIDQELYGYENEACVAFHSDESDELDTVETFEDILNFTVDNLPLETRQIHNENAKNFGLLALDSDNEAESSDSDTGSPVPQKKGLRRFFCMPKKAKVLKPTSSKGSSVRRSLRRPKKKDTSLLEFED